MLVRNNEDGSLWTVSITDGYDPTEQDLDTDEPITLKGEDDDEITVTLRELMENYEVED